MCQRKVDEVDHRIEMATAVATTLALGRGCQHAIFPPDREREASPELYPSTADWGTHLQRSIVYWPGYCRSLSGVLPPRPL